MFKNKAFQVHVVDTKEQKDAAAEKARNSLTPEQIVDLTKETVKYVALLAGAGYVLKKAVDTASDATLIITKAHF